MLALSEEIGSDFTIDEVSCQVHPTATNSVEFNDFKIYMGLCEADELIAAFDDNYISGTKTLVLNASSLVITGNPDEWASLLLDAAYDFDAEAGNLVIEFSWESCVDYQSFYTYSWDTGTIRSVANTIAGAPSNPTGTLSSAMSRLMLTGTSSQELTSVTFGTVKGSFCQ
ncbi:MAG: hypothetical protein KAR40_14400 [Candidatus Sabulitectum sp.]|nr:hypothetical protein [Candidatus Sabulitectum sp.]